MTDDATPKPITRERPTLYPKQLPLMLSTEMYDDIVATAEAETGAGPKVSKAEVARRWLESGRKLERDGLHVP